MAKPGKISILTKTENEFMELVWDLEPINSTALVRECEKKFDWKKSTTYTVLKNLCNKGLLINEQAMVTSVLKRDEYYGKCGRDYVDEHFHGSLPMFISAFCGAGVKLSEKDKEEIKKLIDGC
ncbi:MAG: BlaI/MecI/CopY family transcriptional regulator [Lachnospira sp.]